MIYGAGEIGSTLARQFAKGKLDYEVVGFIDDDPALNGSLVVGVPVSVVRSTIWSRCFATGRPGCLVIADHQSVGREDAPGPRCRGEDWGADEDHSVAVRNGGAREWVARPSIFGRSTTRILLGRQMIEIDPDSDRADGDGASGAWSPGRGGASAARSCRQICCSTPSSCCCSISMRRSCTTCR